MDSKCLICLQFKWLEVPLPSLSLQTISPVTTFLCIYKLKINPKLQEKTLERRAMSFHHVPTVSCVDLPNQSFIFKQLPWSNRNNKEIESAHVLKLSKLINSSASNQSPCDVRFLRAVQSCFTNEVFLVQCCN